MFHMIQRTRTRRIAALSYQWIADGTDIEGATGSTYTLTSSEQGQTIQVRVTFTDDRNSAETLTSAATEAVIATVPTAPSGLTVAQGAQPDELDASWQAPSSNGGSGVTGYRVQWKEAADSWDTAADVSEATVTGTTHAITGLTGGVEYAVRVIATNLAGDGPPSTEATGTPAGGTSQQNTESENSAPIGLPTISGTPEVEQTLTADTSGISDQDGLTNVSYSYQWTAGGADISGATGSSLALTASQQGQTIEVRVTFDDDAGNTESLTSAATVAVTAKPTPLTASLTSVPATHNGSGEFTFELTFSENVKAGYERIRDEAFTIVGGDIKNATKREQGTNQYWTITVKPDGNASVYITLPETTDCDADAAICTYDKRKLSHTNVATINGPG